MALQRLRLKRLDLALLAPLRELDEVAYLRYASVYRNFSSLEDFEAEIALLRAEPSRNFKVSKDPRNQALIK
jgi:transcriptional repressor NrdR